MATELTDQNFQDTINATDQVVMVDFWAQWCGPCIAMEPVINELAQEYEGKAIIGKLDVDNNPQVAGQFGIRSIPTLLFFKNGKIVDKQVGSLPKSALVKKLEAFVDH